MEYSRDNYNRSSQARIVLVVLMCSGIFRTTWSTMNVENVPYVYFGISLEKCLLYFFFTYSESFVANLRGFVPSPYERELPVMKIVQDLYNFLSSFESDRYSIRYA